jgi:hypothetical protein
LEVGWKDLVAKGKTLLDAVFVRGMDASGAGQAAPSFGILPLKQMPFTRAGAEDLATRSYLKAFRCRFLRFDAFWTSHRIESVFEKDAQYRWHLAVKQGLFFLPIWNSAAQYGFPV